MKLGQEVRFGVIGVGNMGQFHAKKLFEGAVPGARLAAVADRATDRLAAFEGVARFDSAEAMLASGGVDVVLIATPHYSHTAIGVAALKAGLHVIVEKPISVHKADCETLIAAHRPDSGQVFAAMFNQRTDPRYRKLKELLDGGVLGRLQRINWIITDWFRTEEYYRSGDWRATWAGEGGGVLLNQCPHQLDLWQWLFGMPQRVFAQCQIGRFHRIEVEDSVTALMDYASGVQGVFITSTGETPGTNRLEVAGEHGKVVIEGGDGIAFTRNEISSVEFSLTSKAGFDKPAAQDVRIPVTGQGEQHVGILKNVTAAIRGEAELIAPAAEGIHSVELANAMMLSTVRDQPVSLPIDSAVYAAVLKKRVAESTVFKQTGETLGAAADLSGSFRSPTP